MRALKGAAEFPDMRTWSFFECVRLKRDTSNGPVYGYARNAGARYIIGNVDEHAVRICLAPVLSSLMLLSVSVGNTMRMVKVECWA